MASPLVRLVVGMFVLVQLYLCEGADYKVGESAGWTAKGNIDYKRWAETKSFEIGDVIGFEYNPQFHNVLRVTHAMYRVCNTSAPLAIYTTGNDSITITKKGHNHFICGFPGHCQAGQKVDINVVRDSDAPTSPPSSTPSTTPAPSPNGASSVKLDLSSIFVFADLVMMFAFI